MTNTPNLNLPLIDQNQNQKQVTHNLALQTLDALVNGSALGWLSAPPNPLPSDGTVYLVLANATGAFSGQDGKIAAWQFGAWNFYTPKTGWEIFDQSANAFWIYTANGWALSSETVGSSTSSSSGQTTTAGVSTAIGGLITGSSLVACSRATTFFSIGDRRIKRSTILTLAALSPRVARDGIIFDAFLIAVREGEFDALLIATTLDGKLPSNLSANVQVNYQGA